MKQNWLTKLIALMVLAALLVPAALAEGIANGGEPAPAEQEPFELENNETYGEQAVVLGGELPFQGLSAPPAWNGGGETSAEANGSALALKPRKLTIPVNGYASATLTNKTGAGLDYECSDTEVVMVSFDKSWRKGKLGLWIFGLKEGTAEIKFISETHGAVTLTVTVRAAEAGDSTLSLSTDGVTVRAGDSADCVLTFTLPEGEINAESSDPDVADVGFGNWRGPNMPIYILGRKKGSATITFTNEQNEDTVALRVRVTKGTKAVYPGKGRQDGKQKCRALVIGISDWATSSQRMAGSARLMGNMLDTVKGPKGRAWAVTEKFNLTISALPNAIHDAFGDADEDDISLFFICTHGDEYSEDEKAGRLGFALGNAVLTGELAEMLKAVPGKIVIIIDSCGSGAGVFDTQTEQNALRKAAEGFDRAVVEAFALADTSVADDVLSTTAVKGEAAPNPGELRVPDKFYVLTASRYLEEAWGSENEDCTYFTKWLVQGVGKKGRMKADKNRDGIATLVELYKYISKVGDDQGFDVGEDHLYYQHVQMYPKNSAFEVFKRK